MRSQQSGICRQRYSKPGTRRSKILKDGFWENHSHAFHVMPEITTAASKPAAAQVLSVSLHQVVLANRTTP
jgi:hypothetical protein